MKPLDDEDWLPINEEKNPPCPTLRVCIKAALPDDPNVVSYRKRIAQDEDENHSNRVYSVFDKHGVRSYLVDESFPYEMYRYEKLETALSYIREAFLITKSNMR